MTLFLLILLLLKDINGSIYYILLSPKGGFSNRNAHPRFPGRSPNLVEMQILNHRAGPQAGPPQNIPVLPTVHGVPAVSREGRTALLLSRSPLSDMHIAGAQLMSGLRTLNKGAPTPAMTSVGESVSLPVSPWGGHVGHRSGCEPSAHM